MTKDLIYSIALIERDSSTLICLLDKRPFVVFIGLSRATLLRALCSRVSRFALCLPCENTAAKRMRMRHRRAFPVCTCCSFQINFVVRLAVFKLVVVN